MEQVNGSKTGTSSYWMQLYKTITKSLEHMVIVHHTDRDEVDAAVAEQMLFLTLGQGLPERYQAKRAKRLIQELREYFTGDWGSHILRYRCKGGCGGDGEKCRREAIAHATTLVSQALFSAKMVIPVPSRWWKCAPAARKVLLGCGLHQLFRQASARYRRGDAQAPEGGGGIGGVDGANASEEWHAIHGFRVGKTFEFFNSAATVVTTATYLQAVSLTSHILAWLMRHDALLQRHHSAQVQEEFYGSSADLPPLHGPTGARASTRSRADHVRAFFCRVESPVRKALEEAVRLLDPGARAIWFTFKVK